MKNCEPFVFLPAFAIERIPGPVCLSLKFSSKFNQVSQFHTPNLKRIKQSRRQKENKRQDLKHTSKLLAINGLSARSVVLRKVATLEHESGDDTVEGGTGVAEAVLARAEFAEVLCGLGDVVVEELHHDAAGILAVDGDVELS